MILDLSGCRIMVLSDVVRIDITGRTYLHLLQISEQVFAQWLQATAENGGEFPFLSKTGAVSITTG